MRFLTLVTENFKRLGTFSCQFTDGLNVIAGNNARGKSTLLQAIQCALFGATVVPGKVDKIPTWGSKNFKVQLSFELDGSSYEVSRNKSTASVQKDGHLVANGNTAATTYIEQLLNCTAKDYDLFIQSKQKASAGALTYGATALNRKVEEYAGIELIDKVQSLAQTKATLLRGEAKAAPSEEQIKELEEVLNRANEQYAATLKERDEVYALPEPVKPEPLEDPKLSLSMTAQRDATNRQLTKLEHEESRIQGLEAAVVARTAELAELSEVNTEELAETRQALADEGAKLRAKLETEREQAAKSSKLADAVQRAKDQLTECQATLASSPVVSEGELKAAVQANEADQAAYSAALSAKAGLKSKLEQLTEALDGSACPTCGQSLADHDPETLRAEIGELEAKLPDAEAAVTTAGTKMRESARAVGELEAQAEKHLHATEMVKQAEGRVTYAEKELAAAPPVLGAEQLTALEQQVNDKRDEYIRVNELAKIADENNRRYAAAKTRLTTAQGELSIQKELVERLDTEFALLPEPPTDEEITARAELEQAALTAYNEWRIQAAEHSNKKGRADELLNLVINAKTLHQTNYDSHVKAVEAAKSAEGNAFKYDLLIRFLRDKRQAYMKEVWDVVLGMAGKLLRDSYGEITALENRDGEFWYQEEGTWAPADSLSGAQQSFVGVNLRIGLARALYGANSPLIFDEPTESCTEENAAGMAGTIATAARQVLLITHRESDQALAKNIINVGE